MPDGMTAVVRYFAWATDGGFLGVHFNIEWMIENIPLLEEVDAKKAARYSMGRQACSNV